MRTALSIAVGMTLALAAPAALAQDTQAGGTGTAGGGVEANVGGGLPPPKAKAAAPPTEGGTAKKEDEDNTPDHEKFAGHFAVGYLGLTNIPLGGGAGAG